MRRLLSLAILSIVPLVSGCLAVAGLTVGAGVVGYVYYDKNEARQEYTASFEKTWKATLASLRSLEYQVGKDAPHELDTGTVVVGDVKIQVAKIPGGKTRVSVRVGTFHTEEHRRRAGLILEKIEAEL